MEATPQANEPKQTERRIVTAIIPVALTDSELADIARANARDEVALDRLRSSVAATEASLAERLERLAMIDGRRRARDIVVEILPWIERGDCWTWNGRMMPQVGDPVPSALLRDKTTITVRRVIYWAFRGKDPAGGRVVRTCATGNIRCVRPEHMVFCQYGIRSPAISFAPRFWPMVNKRGPSHPTLGHCWDWTGALNDKGYGHIGSRLTHRLSFEMVHGQIPPGLFVCHRCDRPSCVRPEHLFLGTPAENSADMVAKGRSTLNRRCGERASYRKLTIAQVRELLQRKSAGAKIVDLARTYGISRQTVREIIQGKAWARALRESAAQQEGRR